jgi:hypothetical protein
MNIKAYQVGDIIRPSDGSKYRGKIIYLSKEEDIVRHQCLTTGMVYEKSYFGFFCRYCTLDEYDVREKEIAQEYSEEIKELESKSELTVEEENYLQYLKDSLRDTERPIE